MARAADQPHADTTGGPVHSLRPTARAHGMRQHGARQSYDRRYLEHIGWRTTLEYRENAERGVDGTLASVQAQWRAEGEMIDAHGELCVVVATGVTAASAWRRLRRRADRVSRSAQRTQLQGA